MSLEAQSGTLPNLEKVGIAIAGVYLVHARYLDSELPADEPRDLPDELPVGLQLAFDRPSADRLVIALTVRVEMDRPYRVEVSYAGDFRMVRPYGHDEREETWKRFAKELAPIVLYPYVREAVLSLAQRGRASAVVLPILSFGGLGDNDIEIPPAPHQDQLGLGQGSGPSATD